jgi:hypothetical protein
MNLKFLKTEKCPTCGCSTIISESIKAEMDTQKLSTHCNGELWETREFLCGCVINYIPNFQKEVVNKYYHCQNDPDIIKNEKELKKVKNEINKIMENQKNSYVLNYFKFRKFN